MRTPGHFQCLAFPRHDGLHHVPAHCRRPLTRNLAVDPGFPLHRFPVVEDTTQFLHIIPLASGNVESSRLLKHKHSAKGRNAHIRTRQPGFAGDRPWFSIADGFRHVARARDHGQRHRGNG